MGRKGSKESLKWSEDTTGSSKAKLRLTGPEQTTIPMVFFRSLDAQLPEPILGDPYSKGILEKCDVDLNASHFIKDDRFIEYVMNRTKQLDNWCQVRCDLSLNSLPHHWSYTQGS